MKRTFLTGLMVLAASWAHAALYTQTFNSGASVGTVAEGSPIGKVFSGVFNNALINGPVTDIIVSLNVSGGYSGGFYLTLVGPDGTTRANLMNTPGTSSYGMNLAFANGGTPVPSGSALGNGITYAPNQSLSALNGQSANGTWTLYFADLASDGGNATLNSWTLGITTVPEPVNVALMGFGGVVVLGLGLGVLRKKFTKTVDLQ